jgi:RNA polymerase sigma-70 factor (ECF subfamily)
VEHPAQLVRRRHTWRVGVVGLEFPLVGPDDELVARLRSGDEDAFVALVRQHQGRLLRLAETVVSSRSVAEEVVQDTWLAVIRGVDKFEGRSSVKTWLFHILLNRARSAAGREHRSIPLTDDEVTERFTEGGAWVQPVVPWSDRVDEQLVAAVLARQVRVVLARLPAAQRQVLILRDIEGLDPADVSALLSVSDGHQRVLLHRARRRVRQALAAEMEAV